MEKQVSEKDFECMGKLINGLRSLEFGPYGALVVNADGVYCGYALGEASPDPVEQAETGVLLRINELWGADFLKGATLYCSCEPDLVGFATAWSFGISRIVYGASIEDRNALSEFPTYISVSELNRRSGNKMKITGGVLEEEVKQLMKEWKENKSRTYEKENI